MIKILLVEDNYTQIISLKNSISEIVPDCHIDMAQTYDTAINFINSNSDYDIFYLDISLSDEPNTPTGIDLGLYIRSQRTYGSTPIIFTTSFCDFMGYAINSIHCYSFLVKPYSFCDIERSLKDILRYSIVKERAIQIKNSDGIKFKVNPSDILYIVAENHNVFIETNCYRFSTRLFTLDGITNELPGYFVRCHKKYIVNIRYIANYDKTTALIHIKDIVIPVGRKYKNDFEKEYS